MGAGSSVSTGDSITAAKMNLKLEDVDDADLGTITQVVLTSGTNPAGTSIFIGADNTNDITLNALTGGDICFAINDTDAVQISATEVELTSGVKLQFLGNDGILDSAGNEVIMVEAVGSAVNYLNVKNAATADPIILECLGTADRGFIFQNDQDEEILILTPQAGGDTELTILNAATGQPIIRVTGTADTGVEIQNAAGEVMLETLSTADPVNWLSVSNADSGNPVIFLNPGEDDIGFVFQAKNAEEILALAAVTDGVNEITITNSIASSPVLLGTTGDDTNIDLRLEPKGSGGVDLDGCSLKVDGDQDTYWDHGTDDTIKLYINGSYDFAFVADSLELQAGSDINVATATNEHVVFVSRNTLAYTDTTNKTLCVIPANADIIDVVCRVTTLFNGSGNDNLDVGTTSGDPDEFVDNLDCSSTGVNRTGDAADMPITALGDVGGASITVLGKYTDQNADASAGAATIEIYWTIA